MKSGIYDSSFGKVFITTQDSKLIGVSFGNPNDLIKYCHKYHNYVIDDEVPATDMVDKVLSVINDGSAQNINYWLFGTPFQNKVWKELTNIPKGTTCSYQQIANKIGHPKSFRAVANACGANPIAIIVPCHRVISSNGSLGGYRWGEQMKKQLLQREGAAVF